MIESNDVVILSGFDCVIEFLDQLLMIYNDSKWKIMLVSFNGSRFDDLLIVRNCMMHNIDWFHGIFTNNSVLSLKIGKYLKCFDLNWYLMGSLKNNCINFKTKN